jgi:hypothetical protein
MTLGIDIELARQADRFLHSFILSMIFKRMVANYSQIFKGMHLHRTSSPIPNDDFYTIYIRCELPAEFLL